MGSRDEGQVGVVVVQEIAQRIKGIKLSGRQEYGLTTAVAVHGSDFGRTFSESLPAGECDFGAVA